MPLKTLLRTSGLEHTAAIASLERLRDFGLIVIEGKDRPAAEGATSVAQRSAPRTGGDGAGAEWLSAFDDFIFDPKDLTGASAAPLDYRKRVLFYEYHLPRITYYELLDCQRSAPKRDIQTAYHRLSKQFHPDRWFRKELGAIEEPLQVVFKWINRAYRTLSDKRRRAEYDQLLKAGYLGPWQRQERHQSGAVSMVPQKTSLGRDALVARGRKLRFNGEVIQAADAYRRALKLAAAPEIALELAELLVSTGFNLDEAHRCIRALRPKETGNYAAMLLEAKILKLRGDVVGARAICRAIAAERPEQPGLSELNEEIG